MPEEKTIEVRLPELDGRQVEAGGLPRRRDAPAGGANLSLGALPVETSLLTLAKKCEAHLAAQADPDAWNVMESYHRHFWLDGSLLPYHSAPNAENRLGYVVKNSFAVLTFCRDTYVVRTSRGTQEWILDPEKPVSDALDVLHRNKAVDAVCCYEVLDHRGIPLKLHESLYRQGAHPYCDPKQRDQARLEVRLRAEIKRQAWAFVGLSAALGFALGFLLRRMGL